MLNKRTANNNSFISGVAVLTASTVIVKIFGFLCKILLIRTLGSQGMGYYNSAYEIYSLFCIVSTSGLPVAMSVMMTNKEKSASVYKTALLFFSLFGVAGTILLFCFSGKFALMLGNPDIAPGIRAISPAVLFISICGVFRGYFQGKSNMLPTALSQIIESAAKLILGWIFADFALRHGDQTELISAYAVAGMSAGTLLSCFLLWIFRITEKKNDIRSQISSKTASELFGLAIPITLSSAIVSLSKLGDTAVMIRRLQHIGFSANLATSLYGCYSTLVIPLFSLIPAFVSAVALPLIPGVSGYVRNGEYDKCRELIDKAAHITLFAAIPSAVAFIFFPDCILGLLFSGRPADVSTAVPLLRMLALALVPSCLITVSSAVLNSLGRPKTALLSMTLGALIKLAIGYILVGIERIGIYGTVIGSIICNLTVIIINQNVIKKQSGWTTDIKILVKLTLSALSGAGVSLLAGKIIPINDPRIKNIAILAITAAVYFALTAVFKVIPISFTPKGSSENAKRRENQLSCQ